ncbi:hypothetical protein BC940DRAFT_180352 [Gongronella butleri]|nr:hypothetical protein BC940DRAFT_180352 [Gongronella butleri]
MRQLLRPVDALTDDRQPWIAFDLSWPVRCPGNKKQKKKKSGGKSELVANFFSFSLLSLHFFFLKLPERDRRHQKTRGRRCASRQSARVRGQWCLFCPLSMICGRRCGWRAVAAGSGGIRFDYSCTRSKGLCAGRACRESTSKQRCRRLLSAKQRGTRGRRGPSSRHAERGTKP